MKPGLNQRQQQILDYLREHDGATTTEVAVACGLSQWGASERLAALYVKRLVGRQRGFHDSLPTRWYAAETKVAR